MPASDVYAENGILDDYPRLDQPQDHRSRAWNVFRTCGRDDQQGKVAGEYIAQHFKDKKVAIVHDKTTYGKGLADETKKAMNSAGVTEVIYEGINAGEQGFHRAGFQDEGHRRRPRLLGRRAHGRRHDPAPDRRRPEGRHVGGDGIATDEFAAIGGPGREGTLMTFGPDPQKREEAKAVLEKFKARNFKPEAYTLYAYAAVQVIAEAAKAINSVDPAKIAAELHTGKTYKTAIGDLAFDAKGDVTRIDYVMYTWQKQPDGTIGYVQN